MPDHAPFGGRPCGGIPNGRGEARAGEWAGLAATPFAGGRGHAILRPPSRERGHAPRTLDSRDARAGAGEEASPGSVLGSRRGWGAAEPAWPGIALTCPGLELQREKG